jgi:predicted  nucleic acid-binding Zn-ribbon protein
MTMLSTISNAIKKLAPTAAITKEHAAVTSANLELDAKIAKAKEALDHAGKYVPQDVVMRAKELNDLQDQRKVNEAAAAALASGVSAAKEAEHSAARADKRAVIEKDVEIDMANLLGEYKDSAKKIAAIVERLERTERAVFSYNLELADGEQPIVSAEASLNRFPLPALHQSVSLPAINPPDEPFRKALTREELQGEAVAREAAQRIALRKQIAGRAA